MQAISNISQSHKGTYSPSTARRSARIQATQTESRNQLHESEPRFLSHEEAADNQPSKAATKRRAQGRPPTKPSKVSKGEASRGLQEGPKTQIAPSARVGDPPPATELPEGSDDENQRAVNQSFPLSEAALEALDRGLKSIDESRRRNGTTDLPHDPSEVSDSERNSSTDELDPREAFDLKWGYLSPLDDGAIAVLAKILSKSQLADVMGRIKAENSKLFEKGLADRNVIIQERPDFDPQEKAIKLLTIRDMHEDDDERLCHERLWDLDQMKCTVTSNEALFQRTLMISLIARHFLIYQSDRNKEQIFDFSVEEEWSCLPMPTRAVDGIKTPVDDESKFLTKPKPDLALCFKREAIMTDAVWDVLPIATKALACAENMEESVSRVFHFLTVEAKAAKMSLDDSKARNQSLNNASQALFNMYAFFRDANLEQVFYDQVRFFSIVAMKSGLLVRIHRAVRLSEEGTGNLGLVMTEQTDYRLQFRYREYARVKGFDTCGREDILNIFKPIMQYARDELCPLLRLATENITKTLRGDREAERRRQHLSFYRYDQPSPKSMPASRKTSRAPSRFGDETSMSENLYGMKLGPRRPPSNRSKGSNSKARDPVSTTTSPHDPFKRPARPNTKRRLDQVSVEEDSEDPNTQDSNDSKRRKTDSEG